MKKTWIALFLALCMLTTLTAASACCAEPSDMDKTQTMEETCPCMMDGKGVDGYACMKGMCDEKCGCRASRPSAGWTRKWICSCRKAT